LIKNIKLYLLNKLKLIHFIIFIKILIILFFKPALRNSYKLGGNPRGEYTIVLPTNVFRESM
jgi:hypothetical protein